ncbi:hypothetical protein CCH79_00001096 [Gambusia affinis]|uniref:Uncharacterized protein n=1 Tax=Gambusia affinis TaxID=33528 RepID=A0A315VSA9_GAMAF|nr:hypothetical protein CCH79_00001096 [Gambusia affinis]
MVILQTPRRGKRNEEAPEVDPALRIAACRNCGRATYTSVSFSHSGISVVARSRCSTAEGIGHDGWMCLSERMEGSPLLRDKQASVLLRESQLLSVMSQNKQIKRLSSRLSSYHSILVAFFHGWGELTDGLSNKACESRGNKLVHSQAGISVAPPTVSLQTVLEQLHHDVCRNKYVGYLSTLYSLFCSDCSAHYRGHHGMRTTGNEQRNRRNTFTMVTNCHSALCRKTFTAVTMELVLWWWHRVPRLQRWHRRAFLNRTARLMVMEATLWMILSISVYPDVRAFVNVLHATFTGNHGSTYDSICNGKKPGSQSEHSPREHSNLVKTLSTIRAVETHVRSINPCAKLEAKFFVGRYSALHEADNDIFPLRLIKA